jgi:hypothetical protein
MGWVDVVAVAGVALLCAAWAVVQRFVARSDPGQPGVEGKCAGCGSRDRCR